MANATIAQSISRQTVAAAIRQAKVEAAEHQQWITAINKASINLEICNWAFDGEVLRISSATGNSRYTVNPEGCECPAGTHGKPCWHRAAWRLLVKASELVEVPVRPQMTEAELAAIVEELYA